MQQFLLAYWCRLIMVTMTPWSLSVPYWSMTTLHILFISILLFDWVVIGCFTVQHYFDCWLLTVVGKLVILDWCMDSCIILMSTAKSHICCKSVHTGHCKMLETTQYIAVLPFVSWVNVGLSDVLLMSLLLLVLTLKESELQQAELLHGWLMVRGWIIIIIIISTTMFMVLSSWQSHCESSPGSFDEMWPNSCTDWETAWHIS